MSGGTSELPAQEAGVERENVQQHKLKVGDECPEDSAATNGDIDADSEEAAASIGLGIADAEEKPAAQSESTIIRPNLVEGVNSQPLTSPVPTPTVTTPQVVPFKLKRSSMVITSPPPGLPIDQDPSSPSSHSSFLSPTSATSSHHDGHNTNGHPEWFEPNARRTSIVFSHNPSTSISGSLKGQQQAQSVPSVDPSGTVVAFESIALEDDTPNEIHDNSSPFVYASPAVAHSTKGKRASWSHAASSSPTGGGTASSPAPRNSAGTDFGDGKVRRPISWTGQKGSYGTNGSAEKRRSRDSEVEVEEGEVNVDGGNGTLNYQEPADGDVNGDAASVPKPRIHAPPAIPHSANPAIARAMSPTSKSGQASFSSDGDHKEEKPKRKFTLIRIHSREKKNEGDKDSHLPTAPTMHPTAGPSKFEQVRSQTRPVFLPPKPKEEDEKHLKDWEDLMDSSKQADSRREAQLEKQRLEKEKRMAENLPMWESLLVDDKMDIRRKVNGDPKLKQMWFEGVPSHMRGKIWSRCIGNPLALSKDSFKVYNSRAQRAVKAGRFPQDVLDAIESDSQTTLPATKMFGPGSPMQEELRDLLLAWFVCRFDEGLKYTSNVRHIAGMLLLTMNLQLAFVALRNLLDRPCLHAFYNGLSDEVEAYYRIFESLEGELFPKIYTNCKRLGVRIPASYFSTLFLHQLPYEAATRAWDLIMLEGDGHIMRVALAILAILEPRLYFPDRNEIVSVLEGNNPASLAIVAREKERARQRGQIVPSETDGVLTALGVDEVALFDALARDGWKEARFSRLSQRELPD